MSTRPALRAAAFALLLGFGAACGPSAEARDVAPEAGPAARTESAPVAADRPDGQAWVERVVRSEFGGLFSVDTGNTTPAWLTGDWDGDGTEDLLVVARLRGDATAARHPGDAYPLYSPLDTGMEPGEYDEEVTAEGLADRAGSLAQLVVHDVRGAGTHRRAALFAAMDGGTARMRIHRGALSPAAAGATPTPPPPPLRGDAVLLLERAGGGRALYWDGERFRLYPVDAEPGGR